MATVTFTTRANLVAGNPENIADVADCLDKLQTGVNNIDSTNITDGAIATADLANAAVTTAKLAALPHARATAANVSGVTNGGIDTFAWTVVFNTELYDSDTIFAPGTTVMTCQTAGLYMIDSTCDVSFPTSTSEYSARIEVVRSGSAIFHSTHSVQPFQSFATNSAGIPISFSYRLAASDTVRLKLGYTGGGGSPTFSNLSFGISLLSP